MPKFNGRIVAVENNGAPIWEKNGKKIWKVTVDVNGRTASCKTWEQTLATVGYQGEIESYDKMDDRTNTLETWISPPRSEQSGNAYQSRSAAKPYTPRDTAADKAMWAIEQAVVTYQPVVPSTGPTGMHLADIEIYAVELFNMVDRVKTGATVAQQSVAAAPAAVTNAFGSTEVLNEGGASPWPQTTTQNNLPL